MCGGWDCQCGTRPQAHPGWVLVPLSCLQPRQFLHTALLNALRTWSCPAGAGTGAPCLQDCSVCCPKSCGSSKSLASASARYTPAATAALQRLVDPSTPPTVTRFQPRLPVRCCPPYSTALASGGGKCTRGGMRCAVLPDALLQPVKSLTHLERSSAAASSRSGHECLGDY